VNTIVDTSGNSTAFSGTSTYGYDAAGRMTSDSQKGTVAYNHLGLVKTVTKNSDVLTYTYDANSPPFEKAIGNKYCQILHSVWKKTLKLALIQLVTIFFGAEC